MTTFCRAESGRLTAVGRLQLLDTLPEPEFDELLKAAALACGVPISLLSLLDAERRWFKADVGVPDATRMPREVAFCHHAIAQEGILEVSDATTDPRFLGNPLVAEAPGLRFYAGVPLTLSDGSRVGTLCVIDHEPRQLTPTQREMLIHLSRAAVRLLETRRAADEFALGEARVRTPGAALSLGAFTTDTDGACTYANERWRAIFGMTSEEALGHGWRHGLHPEDRDDLFAQWRRDASRGLDFAREFRVQRDDGTVRHVRAVARPVLAGNGQLSGHIGSVEDVTERVLQHETLERAYRKLQMATESGRIGVWELELDSGASVWTPQMFALYGLPAGLKRTPRDLWLGCVHPEDREAVVRRLREVASGEDRLDEEYRVVWGDGSVHHLRASAHVEHDVEGKAVRMVGICWDVTPLRHLTVALAEQHELLRVTLQSIGDAVITTDAVGRVTWQNPLAERMTDWRSAEAVGRPLRDVFHIVDGQTREAVEDPVLKCMRSGEVTGLADHTLLIARDGSERSIEDSAAPILDQAGVFLGAVLVFRDVTARRRLSSEMTFRATHDALTGLVNRYEFEARLQERWDASREDQSMDALMFIDLDQFKLVNDACGHAAGDKLLVQVSRLLADVVRGSDTLARLGGDEFGVLLEHCGHEQARRFAQQICERMEAYRFAHGEQRFQIGTSIGLVPFGRRWEDASAAMRAADASCYAAKEAGRNRVHVWTDSDKAMQSRQGDMRWATRLAQALDEKRFVLHLQRIEPLGASESGLHAEVLIRLQEADGRLVMPSAFLPAAERFDLITRLDRWVLRHTVESLVAMPDLSDVELLCVNLSGRSIGDRVFHREAIELLEKAGNEVCRRLCLEVTETAAVTNMGDAALFIEQARGLGIRVALDDFGAGASSFGYLRTLSVDRLKIDGHFITGLSEDPLNEVAVRSFVEAARVLGLETVAEFVDSPATLERVRELGIDYAQGFLVHRPELLDITEAAT